MGTIMNFKEILLEMLLEGKLEDTLARHPTIPDDVKQDYLRQIPAKNAQHLDWVLTQHSKGNITSSHNISGMLDTFNKVKSKLPKKQIHQYGSMDELHTTIVPHQDNIKKTDNEKSKEGTETLYSSPTMTVTQHHNYESTISAANLPNNNKSSKKSGLTKATWCVSVGDGGGAGHYAKYTDKGFNPVYTIEHHHSDGTSSKHMLVYDHSASQGSQELRNEIDHKPGFSTYTDTRPDLLDHYAKENPEIENTPIAHFFSDTGREQYRKEVGPDYLKLKKAIADIHQSGISDEKYMDNFKAGQEKRHGAIHNRLAEIVLNEHQLNHLVEHGNESCKHDIARRKDLSEEHTEKLANTSNMLVHHFLLLRNHLSDNAFNTIVNKAHPENVDKVIKHHKFNESHIEGVLTKKMADTDLTPIVHRFYNDLQPHHISSLIDKGNTETRNMVIGRLDNKLTPEHISALIDKGDGETHEKLINYMKNKLEPHHIDELMAKENPNTYANLVNNSYSKLQPSHIATINSSKDERVIQALGNRVHDKLESHDISKLIRKGDSDISNRIIYNIPEKLEPHHISELINNNDSDVHRDILKKLPNKLDSSHISSLIDKGNYRTHFNIIKNLSDKLEPKHISSLIDNGDPELHNDLIGMIPEKLDSSHIKQLIDKGDDDTRNLLLSEHPDKIKPEHIGELIRNGSYNTNARLVNEMSDKLEPHHITALIHSYDKDIHGDLINNIPHKLNSTHVNELVKRGDSYTHSHLVQKFTDKLEPHHIAGMLKYGNNNLHTDMMRHISDKLEPDHIKEIIRHSYTNSAEIVNKLGSKLEDSHISSLINKRNYDTNKELIDKIPEKLEPHHIKELIDNEVNLNRAYHKLSPESKKIVVDHVKSLKDSGSANLNNYPNVHADIDTGLKEWNFINNNFERLLKESLKGK
jgi:hypothetical protein